MAVEWEAEKKSESSSDPGSEVSSDELTDQQDSDCSENSSECSSCLSHRRDTQTFAELESISEEEVPEILDGPRPTDLESCRDFVQSLAAQVEAMQEAIRKSKENILDEPENNQACVRNKQTAKKKLRVGSDVYSDVAEEGTSTDGHLIPDYMNSVNGSGLEDDGSYETPMKCRERHPKPQNGPSYPNNHHQHHHHHHHHHHHQSSLNNSLDQSEYEEVLRVPRRHHSRPESSQNYMAVTSMYINTEVPMNNSLRTDENNTVNSTQPAVDDTAIYEFPPADDSSDNGDDCNSSLRGSLSSNHHDDVIYKYDGPIIFGASDTSEVVHIEERDSVKKWDPVSKLWIYGANLCDKLNLSMSLFNKLIL